MKKFIVLILCCGLVCLFLPSNSMAATEAEKQQAIDDGLAWLASQQQANGSWAYNQGAPVADTTAATAAAVLAFAEEGHTVTSGTAYSTNVQNALDYIFSQAQTYGIGMQAAGNPDVDGDSLGVKFVLGGDNARDIYTTGLVVPAIVAGGTQASVVTTGSQAGQTYAAVVRDTVDYLAYAQNEGAVGVRGGWRYYANAGPAQGSDNSTSQWPVIGLLYAGSWGINAPAFVEAELDMWVDYIQNPDGGSDYPSGKGWGSNVSRTGTLLAEMAYSNDPLADPNVQAALNYLNTQWLTGANATWNGNFGHPYAMWAAYKGLELMIGVDDETTITNLPADPGDIDNPDHGWNWWESYCDWLVNNQNAAGSWNGYAYWAGPLATAWSINILAATEIPPPQVPEPSTMFLIGTALVGMGIFARRRRKK